MPQRSPEVEQTVRDWLDAKQAADGAAIRAGLSDYGETLAIGTDASEWWAGAAAFADAHAAGAGFMASLDHVEAHCHGPVAWAAIRAVVETDEAGGMPVRLTLVLVQDGDGAWHVAQSHASVPDAG